MRTDNIVRTKQTSAIQKYRFVLVTPDLSHQVVHIIMKLLFPADLKKFLNPGYYAKKHTLPPSTPIEHQTESSNAAPESSGTGNQLKIESKKHLEKVKNSLRQYVAEEQDQRGMEQNYIQLPKTRRGIEIPLILSITTKIAVICRKIVLHNTNPSGIKYHELSVYWNIAKYQEERET